MLSRLSRGHPVDNEIVQSTGSRHQWLLVPRSLVERVKVPFSEKTQIGFWHSYWYNLNKLKQEDELHIYDAYRVDLQIQQEFTLEVKRWKARLGIISHMQGKTRPSLWDIVTCNQKIVSASLLYFNFFSYNATLYSKNPKIFQRFETYKAIFSRHNVTEKTIGLDIARHSAPIGFSRRHI